ncbi:MAG: 4-alpha-glucanotransferase, partial [Bacteroidota bacterium]
CSTDGREIQWDLISLASRSLADLAIFPFQDILGLGSEGRMNFPGTAEGNWEWRFSWSQVGPEHAKRIHELSALFGRIQ